MMSLACDVCGTAFEHSARGQVPARCGAAECDRVANRDRQRRFLANARANRERLAALERVLGRARVAELVAEGGSA